MARKKIKGMDVTPFYPKGDCGPKWKQFAEALAENEGHMAKMAAFAVTCEQFMIDEEEGYDLLAEAAENHR